MTLDDLKQRLPEHAKDLKLNLDGLRSAGALTPAQVWGAALASALASRHADTIRAVADEAGRHLDAAGLRGARAAAAIMAMNNIYYRSLHLLANDEYARLPARLRMAVIGNHGADPVDFELWSLAVSAVNGCGQCLEAHERNLRKHGLSALQVQDALRVAAVIHAVAATLDAEDALASAAA